MTEVTRVPLQPIAKGSLTKLWLGVIVAVLIGAGLAWAAMPKGVSIDTITEGTGDSPKIGEVVFVKYVGKLADGTEFDRSQELPMPPGMLPEGTPMLLEEGTLIPGFITGLTQMRKGGKYELFIPSDQAYGANPQPGSPIPPNADLTFEIEVVDIMSRADVEQRIQALQAMMQQQQGQQEGAAPAPAQ
ncbi:FKBP-type peptidyl-prolyl cis-trans isomerase [Qipengyuania sp. 6B39]|uniref:FKBP-type peptidyl-prolyl cis-trans isomerase n=1 Tax=Qipengyuania proteolytica TaxID=2867239 RepID=UPI001C8A47C2|nr:FKBP-type peptidyl-prolyl cis-trans isomerase [Qipengyuania proteolytica]MBX7496719.1 FKBP-type peptidyl-prolyl cis-trans isomerase [Qipengyuania proteolytica]